MKKEYKLQNGRTAVFKYDANGIGKITVEAMDYLIDMLPRWIPCSERLPEKKGDYLVTDDSGGAAWVEKAWFMRSDDGSVLWEYVNVTAWMPLPEPYREETES